MLAKKQTHNSIARSVRSKSSHLIYLAFFLRMEDIRKLEEKQGQRHSAEYLNNNNLIWSMVVLSWRL